MTKRINIGIVDTQKSFCQGFDKFILAENDIQLTTTFHQPLSKNDLLRITDILIYNIYQESLGGPTKIMDYLSWNPSIKVIAIANENCNLNNSMLYKLGYYGSFSKSNDFRKLIGLIRQISLNRTVIFPKLNRLINDNLGGRKNKILYNNEYYTTKEIEVIKHTCMELTNEEISKKMCVSKRTIEGYKSRIMEKLNSRHPATMFKMGIKLKLIKY